jgi:hypothetical protein
MDAVSIHQPSLGLAEGNIECLPRKVDGIARTLGHEPSIAQAAPTF